MTTQTQKLKLKFNRAFNVFILTNVLKSNTKIGS